jgi:indole-3-glycerol phosphate synthase
MILDRIVGHKLEEVNRRKTARPYTTLLALMRDMPEPRDFRAAISTGTCSIIAEVKKRSPSKGVMRTVFDPAAIALIYEQYGAAALSVLTDQHYFGGSAEDLMRTRAAVSLPVLRKDFIVDPYQIAEARIMGADAVLLIARILEQSTLKSLKDMADSLGLCPLVEVHTLDDLDKALNASATVIGINNRNLDTFTTDLTVSIDLAARVPADRIVVSESGITTRSDIDRLRGAGIHAFLVGEALMTAEDMGITLRNLSGVENDGDRG